ncbi:MAG: energy-coupling factor transporter ATPase [Bacilli bacterium]|nr:energy-coupling factor transporter ATPase [Bacilli bacterium]
MEKAIEVNGLSYSYQGGDKKALDGVSFSVDRGSYTCIIGHNGSGKSTLAKVLIGLLGGFKGEVKLLGEPLNRRTIVSLRRRVGIVFQNPDNQFVGSTVGDDIAFGLENLAMPQSEMAKTVHEFALATGMEKELEVEPSSLSGGQKQRVALAGVLAMSPDIMILDEATSMLDPKGKGEIDSLIHKIKKSKPELTILSITHDLEEASHADQVIVLNEGKVLLSGEPSAVFEYEEELREAHLEVPFLYRFIRALKQEGIEVPPSLNSLESLEEYLCR